ncbi:S41 family peptidase, partial [Paracoccaceae bacterium]|nr:S41 family peptidase [Paracoccaceae bacterium]
LLNPVYSKENKRETYEQLDLFGQVFDLIKSKYVEEVKSKELIEAAINGMLSSLDPHSGFLVPRSFDDMQVDTKGSFGGLGIEVTQQDGFVKVVSPMDDTPAYKAGVLAGDFITFVDDKPMLGLTLSEAVEIMRGPVGSSIKLTIVREGLEDPIEVQVTRDVIKLTAAKVRIEDDIVVMRVTTFNEQTIPNLEDGMKATMEKAGVDEPKGFVLDLRNNPGGLLSVAISVTDLFLDQGEIVSTRDKEGKGERYKASKGDIANGKPLVILINAGSASASEIVAGALQDHQRAIVLGTKSFGKGSVQSVLPMGKSGGIRLTTARYYTPSGRSIQALGVTPDVFLEFKRVEEKEEEKRRTFSEADLEGALSNDSLTDEEKEMLRKEELSFQEIKKRRDKDNQLAHALDLIKGLSVLSVKE